MNRHFIVKVFRDFGILYNSVTCGSIVKNSPDREETQETQVLSLGWEDPPEECTAIHSMFLAWRMAQTEQPGRLQSPKSHKEQTRLKAVNTAQKPVSALHTKAPGGVSADLSFQVGQFRNLVYYKLWKRQARILKT